MEILTSKQIKKIILGILVSDGYIIKEQRFGFGNKSKEYVDYTKSVLDQITGVNSSITKRFYKNYSTTGHQLNNTNKHPYFRKLRKIFYPNGKKTLTPYICNRLDAQAFAHIWMGDGTLKHTKNRVKNTIQNNGILCLESFTIPELELLVNRLNLFNIHSTLIKVPWGHGYRVRFMGPHLQRFMSLVYPYILDDFKYKTRLYYKTKLYVDMSLPNAEHYVIEYSHIDDIVRSS
jgi:hypothetical protein